MRMKIRNTCHHITLLKSGAAIAAALALLLTAGLPLAAQDDDFSEGFSTESASSGEETGEESSGEEGGFSSFGGSAAGLEWSGFISTTARYTADYNDPATGAVNTYPELGLDLTYSNDNSEAVAELRFSRNWTHEKGLGTLVEESLQGNINTDPTDNLEPAMNFKWYLQRMINQAHVRLFYDNFDIQAGFLKEVWGTGDKVHVVDPLNPTDYYDFVNPDYMDRKVAEFMFKGNVRLGQNGRLELVYVPTFTPDAVPQSGDWVPVQVDRMEDYVSNGGIVHYPTDNFMSLDDGQYAVRAKGTFGGVDLGAIYYYGRKHQPVTRGANYISGIPADLNITYPRTHLFGLESATAIKGFNLRAEAAFTMTDDWDEDKAYESREDNPAAHYVAGFDRDLGISELNLNIQGTGAYYWNVGPDSEELSNTVSIALTDSWSNNTIEPELAFAYTAEGTDFFADPDLMLRPKVEFSLVDDVSLTAEYAAYYGPSNGRFGQFEENDYLQVTFDYAF